MRLMIPLLLFVIAGCVQQDRIEIRRSEPNKPESATERADSDATADRILKKVDEEDFIAKWQNHIYPALKRKYNKPVTREVYETWRNRYFEDEVKPYFLRQGYNLAAVQEWFMKGTDRPLD